MELYYEEGREGMMILGTVTHGAGKSSDCNRIAFINVFMRTKR